MKQTTIEKQITVERQHMVRRTDKKTKYYLKISLHWMASDYMDYPSVIFKPLLKDFVIWHATVTRWFGRDVEVI